MVLTVHHLRRSQSERIVWLCEELGLNYSLQGYDRSPVFAPASLKKLHPAETAPVITDDDDDDDDGAITLAESGAVAEYILVRYDGKKKLLVLGPEDGKKKYTEYLFWIHFATGTLQPAVSTNMFLRLAQVSAENNPIMASAVSRREHALGMLNDRLRTNEWLAGEKFTAADIMTVTSLTTMRLYMPYGLEAYPYVVEYLKRVGRREGYRRAMAKGDPGFEPVLGAEAPKAVL